MNEKQNPQHPGSQGGHQPVPSPTTPASGNSSTDPGNKDHEKLHLFINNIKFDESDGVKSTMTGRELAALVPVDADNAEIRRKNSEALIGANESVQIKMADHFEIIRRSVQAGYYA